jgi:hypothetical protein
MRRQVLPIDSARAPAAIATNAVANAMMSKRDSRCMGKRREQRSCRHVSTGVSDRDDHRRPARNRRALGALCKRVERAARHA